MNDELDFKNYGLLEDLTLNPKDWRFGGISGATKTVLREDGQYLDFLPTRELQHNGFDSMACVSFSALNCLEMIHRVNGLPVNYSDRFLAKMSGTTPQGNYLTMVAETIRREGLVIEDLWPFSFGSDIRTWEAFYADIPQEVRDRAKDWLTGWNYAWERVGKNDLKDALRYGPVQVTVYAWPRPVNGLYTDGGNTKRNHAVALVGYKEGEYWTIFDHYDKTVKNLVWDYDFGTHIQFSLTPKTIVPMPISIPNDTLVQEVEQSGTFGLYLNGKIILGDEGKLLATWLLRNGGNVVGKVLPMKLADWQTIPKVDLKNNPIT